jgi:RNA polymerase sigma-70 factor (ECF subfamily)
MNSPDPDTLARLERAIRSLPRRQREIFLAVRFDDLSYAEIAVCTGMSVSHIERLFAMAIASIDRQLCAPHWG